MINNTITKIVKKYGTRNPFELADAMNIATMYEELGTINGYYNKPLRMKQIHINCNLSDKMKEFTCAHELGHAIMHPNANTFFFRNATLFSIDKLEMEANTFAMGLLIPNELIKDNSNLTTEQLSRVLGYDKALVELRLKNYREI